MAPILYSPVPDNFRIQHDYFASFYHLFPKNINLFNEKESPTRKNADNLCEESDHSSPPDSPLHDLKS